jgi:hypothetical protein
MKHFATTAPGRHLPRGLLCVLPDPPLGKDFLDAQFSHNRSPLWLKFSGYILNRNVHELDSHSLLCVCEIVVSMGQISPPHKTAGSRPCKIREGKRVSPGVGLIDESKGNCVHGSHKWIFAIGPHVSRIFTQGNTCQKVRCSLGSGRGDGISIEPPERLGPIPGLLSHLLAKRACQGLPLP